MKKFLLIIMTMFLVSCQAAGSGEFEIIDQVYFEPLKENDFMINDYLSENESALDFLEETEDIYRLTITFTVSASKNNKEQFSVNIMDNAISEIVNEYVYPIAEELLLTEIKPELTANTASYTYNYILSLDEVQKEEVITLLKETSIQIKIVGDESGLKEIAYALTDFDN